MSDSNISVKLNDKNKHQSNFRLALDIGTNSIGWALYNIDKNNKPVSIEGAGVRIFSSGRKDKDYTTLNATRRQARLQRRQRDRFLQRKTYLLHLLEKYDLFPKNKFLAKKLANLNPYKLRAKALDKKLDIYHFGRVLFHLNQRRGFKSNRKSANDKESGIISKSIKESMEQLKEAGSRTYGEFLWKRFETMQDSRKTQGSQRENWILARKPIGASMKDNYVVYAQRAMLEDEFGKLWDAQANYHEKLKDNKIKEIFCKAIFHQRPLKQPVVGVCELTGEKRIHKALSSFQKFRILKELNNLSYVNNYGESYLINSMENGIKFRDKILSELFQKKQKVTFSALEKAFKDFFPDIQDFSNFNLNTYNRDFLEGDKTSVILRKEISDWDNWSLTTQDRFIELLEGENTENSFMKTDEEVLIDLKNFNIEETLNLSEDQLHKCLKELSSKLPKGHGQYSKKIISDILPFLEKGKQDFKSISDAGYENNKGKYTGELLKTLPLYQRVLSDHCVEMEFSSKPTSKEEYKNEKEKYKTFRIPNPTVHIAFNQLRLVVNDIIRVYGRPIQIVVETARDLPMGAVSKKQLEKQQKKNKERNQEAIDCINEFTQTVNRDNIIRYQLWKEQKQLCVYSGKTIPKRKLYTAELEVDHILPYSRTLDDSFMNKVLVYKDSNQNKGSETPFEYFSSNKEQWEDILYRIKDLSKNKQWRFNRNAMEKFEENGSFLDRQLNDTRYISKYARTYLERICEQVWTVRGQTTAILRYLFQYEKKNRSDHRNHTKDALVIGLIDRSLIQHISNIAKKREGKNKTRLENISTLIKQEVIPWFSFKKDVKQTIDKIVVSHRRRTKKEGKLHNETAYGILRSGSDLSTPINVIHYVGILKLIGMDKKVVDKKIMSEKIKQDLSEEFKINQKLSKEFLMNYHKKTGIRRIRLTEKKRVIPINNKYFAGAGNYAIQFIENVNGKWDAKVIDTFSANQKSFQPIPSKSRLMKGDMLFFENKFWRLVKFDQNKSMIFVEHCISGNPDDLRKNEHTKCHISQKTPSSLQNTNPKFVDISPCGVVKLRDFFLTKTVRKKPDKSA